MGGDAGLGEAIRAAGGVTELARRIGISQPSVSNWSRVPADRVVAVEAATGVARAVLRPDLYAGTTDAVDDTAVARAQEYALLAALLARPPDAALLKRLAKLESDGTARPCASGIGRSGCGDRCRRGRARIFRTLHRRRPRRASTLRVLLPDRFSP